MPKQQPGEKGFVLVEAKRSSRKKVERLSKALLGRKAFPNFVLRYARPGQFADYLVKRLRFTNELFRLAHYYAFVFRPGPVSFYVAGADVQYGSGNSGPPRRDGTGRIVYNGFDASHVRLGTFSINGDPVCSMWPAKIFEIAQARNIRRMQIPVVFPANCSLANRALMLDAATDLTDALLNRVFAQIEGFTHRALRTMVPATVPDDIDELYVWLERLNERFPALIAKAVRHFAKGRLAEITRDPTREQMQEAKGPDGGPPMYGSEGAILAALIAEIENRGGEFWNRIEKIQALSRADTADELIDVAAARAEVLGT